MRVFAAGAERDSAHDPGQQSQQRRSMGAGRRRCRVEFGDHSEVGVIRNRDGHGQTALDEWLVRIVLHAPDADVVETSGSRRCERFRDGLCC
jgi:hypothetical protein